MRIECPECAARYEVPDERLQPGRTVRCARCGRDWEPVPAIAAAAEPPPAAVVEPEPPPPPSVAEPVRPRPPHPFLAPPRVPLGVPAPMAVRTAPPVPPPPGRGGLVFAWLLTLVVLGGAAWGALEFRGPIVQAWPPSQRVYDALGLAVAPAR